MSKEVNDLTRRMTVSDFRRIFPDRPPYPNPSGLKPLGVAVLVEPYEGEMKTSLIAIPETVSERLKLHEDRAVVIEVGPWAWHDEPEPRAQPGDRVLLAKFCGKLMQGTADGKPYRMVNDRDIYARIVKES